MTLSFVVRFFAVFFRSRLRLAVVVVAGMLIATMFAGVNTASAASSAVASARVKACNAKTKVVNERATCIAGSMKGTPYVWGGTKPSGFDCSGLINYAFKSAGAKAAIPRTTTKIVAAAKKPTKSKPTPTLQRIAITGAKSGDFSKLKNGDMVFFNGNSHMGIYQGKGKYGKGTFIHAPHTGDVVKAANLKDRKSSISAIVRYNGTTTEKNVRIIERAEEKNVAAKKAAAAKKKAASE